MSKIKAPAIDRWLYTLKGGNMVFDTEIQGIVERIFEKLHRIAPSGEERRWELWLHADRGTPEDYENFEAMKEEGYINTYDEFLEQWQEEYPEETGWFHLVGAERNDFRAIFLGRKLIYQSETFEGHPCMSEDVRELFLWMDEEVNRCIEALKNGSYNRDVREHLPFRQRTGTILWKDYWELFPEKKEYYFEDITNEELELFLSNIADQKEDEPVGTYLKEMTANQFYGFCAAGYRANEYEGLEGLSPMEQYRKEADGRDDGLSKIHPDSPVEFAEWLNNRKTRGGHPWEVCRGGNSTHISLYVGENDKGYYLGLAGESVARSIETVKFYNALREEGVAVYLYHADEIRNRILGSSRIGIVPENVPPAYCESWFPGMEIHDFMNLPYDMEEYEKMLPKIKWLEEKEQKLLK